MRCGRRIDVAQQQTVPPPVRKFLQLPAGGTEALAAIALVVPFITLMLNVANGAMGGGVASSMARALGESAPLLLIGMVAFIVDVPRRLTDPSTVLPVQVYLWARSSERAFVERTSGAIIVLLVFLLVMNGLAVILRSRFERRW